MKSGTYFTIEAKGDWADARGATWRMNGEPNWGCMNPGCGFLAPSTPGPVNITYQVNSLIGTITINVV